MKNVHIEALKQFKPPLWSRLLGWFNKEREDQKLKYVTSVRLWSMAPLASSGTQCVVICSTLHLHESKAGHRVCYFYPGAGNIKYEKFYNYKEYIKPWLDHVPNSLDDLLVCAKKSDVCPTVEGSSTGSKWV